MVGAGFTVTTKAVTLGVVPSDTCILNASGPEYPGSGVYVNPEGVTVPPVDITNVGKPESVP